MYHKLTIAIPQGISSFYHNLLLYVKKKNYMYSGDLNNRTPDNKTLQFTDHFIWEQIFLSVILSHLSGIKVQYEPTNPTKKE